MNREVALDVSGPWKAAETSFHTARALAVQTYAELESSLSRYFSITSGMSYHIAQYVFFQIINTKTRMNILEFITKDMLDESYRNYVTGILKHAEKLISRRNKIVHWHEILAIADDCAVIDGVMYPDFILVDPSSIHCEGQVSKTFSHDDLLTFASECDFFARGLNTFNIYLSGEFGEDGPSSAQFERALSYPPTSEHDLFRPVPKARRA